MKTSTAQDYKERIVRTLVYIQQHLDEPLDLDEVAAVAAFSKFHFHRIFGGLVGETLREHTRRLRLERAAGYLKRESQSITDIAFQAGFETHESFTRAFTDMFGAPPSTYRAAHKPAPESASHTHFDDVEGYHAPEYGELPPVEVKELPPIRMVFLRHLGPYGEVGPTWGKLMSWAGMHGLLGPATKMIGLVHDDPEVTPADKLRYDAAITIDRPVQPEGDFGLMEFPAGKYAIITHKGPYQGLAKSYQLAFGGWLPKSGCRVRELPSFEQYVNSPMNAKPEDLITLIHVPVE